MIAALFVESNGPYYGFDDVDPWDEIRDARTYPGPWPVVAHPPCERWGRYWSGGPSAKTRRLLGDDGGCFEAALLAVRKWGGVLEHPEASHAWKAFGLPRPTKDSWWLGENDRQVAEWGWVCQVEQGHYGHPARKKTWLYYVGRRPPPNLIWGPSRGLRLDEGFHSAEERRAARAAGRKPIKRLSKRQNVWTPEPFRDLLVSIAEASRR